MRYFYHDGDRIIAEREGNSWVVRYLHGLKPCGFVSNGQARVYHADRLGSVRWVTDGSQNIVVSYVYEGFGKIVGQNGGGGGPYQFCGLWGYRNDHDAGLMHVGVRYYEVETGRWVQKDPRLGDMFRLCSLNLYIYCEADPINAVDPNGQWKWTIGLALLFAAVGAGLALWLGAPIWIGVAGGLLLGGYIGHHIDVGVEAGKAVEKVGEKHKKEIEREMTAP